MSDFFVASLSRPKKLFRSMSPLTDAPGASENLSNIGSSTGIDTSRGIPSGVTATKRMLFRLPHGSLCLRNVAVRSAPDRTVTRTHNGFSGINSTRIPGGIVSLPVLAALNATNTRTSKIGRNVLKMRLPEKCMGQSSGCRA